MSQKTATPTTITGTLVPSQLSQTTSRPTMARTQIPTMAPVKESTPGKKKMVCTHIKKDRQSKKSKKVSKKDSKSGKGGKGSEMSDHVSESGKGSQSSSSSSSSSSKSGKKGKKKRNKRKRKKKSKTSEIEWGNIWSKSGKRRLLNEMEKREIYFRVHGDVFRDRVVDISTNNSTSLTPPGVLEEKEYVAIYKEVFKDVECYEIDVESDGLPPAFSPGAEMPSPKKPNLSSNAPVSLSPIAAPLPTLNSSSSAAPAIGSTTAPTLAVMTTPSASPTNVTDSFDNLVLERANMTLEDRSSMVNTTGTAAPQRHRTILIHAWVILATFVGGTLLMSGLLIRWYGPRKPMWHIRIPSTASGSGKDESVESRLTDDKRMGV